MPFTTRWFGGVYDRSSLGVASKVFALPFLLFTGCLSPVKVWGQDGVTITGAFTGFTGNVLGDAGPTYMSYCGADTCGTTIPGLPPPTICPDSGCSTFLGMATNVGLGNAEFDGPSSVSFWVNGSIRNNLTFAPARSSNGFPIQVDPNGEFRLGTISFTNGQWVDNATFGFSIVVHDHTASSPFFGSHTFTGFVHLGLTAPTNPNPTPEQNADYIYLTDANGNPVRNPVTLQTLPSMRVYEAFDAPPGTTNVGSATLYGKFGSLDLTRLADPVGGAFLDPSLTAEPANPPFRFQVCPLYDQNVAKKSGSAYPIKIQLCDSTGNNLSSPSIVVHAVSVIRTSVNTPVELDDTGNANPDLDFRYDPTLTGFIFNLSPKGYAGGTYSLNFTATGDRTMHTVAFAVK